MKAIWNGKVIAESNESIQFDNNHYFPASSLKKEYFKKSPATTVCPWKGTANYYDIVVGDKTNEGAAWYYASPSPKAALIEGRVAFWKGVTVSA
ncbi:MAG: DUF427 domain-containing protein [Cryobacterium sp.]|nr:DUF427 domain-containing protein [Oligoflexia bacterium]